VNYFDYRYRVLYADTDQMGITYYANYLKWFEAARTEYFRALGFPYTECEKKGIYLPVAEAHANYLAPSAYDDDITVRTSVVEIGNSTLRFEYQIMNTKTQVVLVTGYTVHVFVQPVPTSKNHGHGEESAIENTLVADTSGNGTSSRYGGNRAMKPCRVPAEIKEVVKEHALLKKRCRCK
jgi:acyl-CoA thioester hydrolase